jgi:hypothetical protein
VVRGACDFAEQAKPAEGGDLTVNFHQDTKYNSELLPHPCQLSLAEVN